MDDNGRFRVTAWCMLAMGIATAFGFVAQQRRIDTLARQVEILEKDSVNHGARLDAQTMAEAEAFRRVEQAAGLPGWVDPLPTGEPKAPNCPECGLKQYPPPGKEHLRKP